MIKVYHSESRSIIVLKDKQTQAMKPFEKKPLSSYYCPLKQLLFIRYEERVLIYSLKQKESSAGEGGV